MKRTLIVLVALIGLCAALPAASSAAGRPGGRISLSLTHAIRAGHSRLTFTHHAVRVRGTLAPYVAHQRVTARITRGRRVLAIKHLAVTPSRTGRVGHFSFKVSSSAPGRVVISVVHAATSAQGRVASRRSRLLVYRPRLSFGARGPLVVAFQNHLRAMGYPASRSGRYDAPTGRAVLAYRKVNGLGRTSSANAPTIFAALAGRGAFRARYPGHGKHVEADLSRQVMVELYGARVHAVYPVSSGKPSTPTVLGSFRFYRKQPGTNSHGMVDSSYFTGGYAIHGYVSVPNYAASHGCLRIPIPVARTVYDWVRIGDRIDVYP